MPLRYRLMTTATALLYLGPLLAGLSGYGWTLAPVFIGIFLLRLVVLRPADWAGGSRVRLASRIAGQTLLVAACLGIGRGLGGVAGVAAELPAMLPVGLSFLAIPLSRLALSGAGTGMFIDTALHRLSSSRVEHKAIAAMNRGQVEAMAARLLALPPDTPDSVLRDHLRRLPVEEQSSLLDVLARRIASHPA